MLVTLPVNSIHFLTAKKMVHPGMISPAAETEVDHSSHANAAVSAFRAKARYLHRLPFAEPGTAFRPQGRAASLSGAGRLECHLEESFAI